MRKVWIESPSGAYEQLFKRAGWEMADSIATADLVQFTGGSDVNPELYGEALHPRSMVHKQRDVVEARLYKACLARGIPMAGICRGGQFLNVMNGGKMYQHVDGHAIGGTHMVINTATGGMMPATSTHHQMMIPTPSAKILGVASEAENYQKMQSGKLLNLKPRAGGDIEVLFYSLTRSLCFQPHPELMATNSPCRKWYMELIEEHLFKEAA